MRTAGHAELRGRRRVSPQTKAPAVVIPRALKNVREMQTATKAKVAPLLFYRQARRAGATGGDGLVDMRMPFWHARAMDAEATTLRERQARQVREAVLEAVLVQLESRDVDDVVMADVAAAAGVSLRTLYRYFPDRASLLTAVGEHVVSSLGLPVEIAGPAQISASFGEAAKRLSTRPQLVRALVRTTAGRAARSEMRTQRVAAINHALESLTSTLDADTGRWATAVITHLCGAASWVLIADETGLDDNDAQAAVTWAIDTLVSALQTFAASSGTTPTGIS